MKKMTAELRARQIKRMGACVLIAVLALLPVSQPSARPSFSQDSVGLNRVEKSEQRQESGRDVLAERRDDRGYKARHGRQLVHVAPRHRRYNNIIVVRPHGHVYWGYGHHHSDADAWKWLTFTAISLKILDNMNEQAQREHEAAQIKASSAPIGEAITWESDGAAGQVVATKQGTNDSGLTCREFQQTVTVGGETEDAYGTACLQADGAWKIVSA